MQIADYAPAANSQAFIKYHRLEMGSCSPQRLSYLRCAPGSDRLLGTFPHSMLVICKGPRFQGRDNAFPALSKSVVKWLLLQTEGWEGGSGRYAGGTSTLLPAVVWKTGSMWPCDSLGLQPIGSSFS